MCKLEFSQNQDETIFAKNTHSWTKLDLGRNLKQKKYTFEDSLQTGYIFTEKKKSQKSNENILNAKVSIFWTGCTYVSTTSQSSFLQRKFEVLY